MTRETDIPIYARIFGLIGANGAIVECAELAWLHHGCLRFVGNTQEAIDQYLNRVPKGVSRS